MEMNELLEKSRLLRERLMEDHTRPYYHFICPEDNGIPGDPNAAFYAGGRYHLMFLYHCCSDGFRYGHMSSADLLHWRRHPDALIPDEYDLGIFSGGAIVEDDGTVYIAYWALKDDGNNGIRLAFSKDVKNHYTKWEKMPTEAVVATENGCRTVTDDNGKVIHLPAADPSNLWKKDGYYYFQAGNLTVLQAYGEDPAYKGDFTYLYRSTDLVHWEPMHRFYQRDASNAWTAENEDDMCPSFLPLPTSREGGTLSDAYLQLFIAHNRGAQYYIGEYDRGNDLFLPARHGRMSWNDNAFFAPEALITPDGRQIMWAWLMDNREREAERFGWCGAFCLPRSLWLLPSGELGMAPAAELQKLRLQKTLQTEHLHSRCCEIELTLAVGDAPCGLRVFASSNGEEYADILYDPLKQLLMVDTRACKSEGRGSLEEAPLVLAAGEKLHLRVFLDASIIEVFANDRQAITRRIYTQNAASDGICVLAEQAQLCDFCLWELDATNPY